MRIPIGLALPIFAAFSLAPAAHGQSSIVWTTTLERAVEFATERGALIMVSIRAPGERGSDRLADVHDRDRRIAKLAASTVNLMVTAAPADDRSPDEVQLRERFLEVESTDPLATPLHLFLDPANGGSIVSSAAGALTPGQLEWLFADALSRADPDFSHTPDHRTRAPRTVRFGSVDARVGALPPDDDELEAAIDTLKRGIRGPDAMRHYRTVLQSDSPTALKFGKTELRRFDGFLGRAALEIVGQVSPPAWADFAIERLDHRTDGFRESAARALESMAVEDARRPLLKAFDREEEPAVRGRLLRAIATCAPDDKTVARLVERSLEDRDATVRLQATMALGDLENDSAVASGVARAFADEVADVRSAAAWVVASRREADLRDALDRARSDERDPAVSEWLDLAVEVLDTPAPLGRFEQFARETAKDRDASDPRAGRRGRRGRPEGDGEPDEKGEGKGKGEGGGEAAPGGGRRRGR